MGNIGWSELIVIFLLVLLFFGAKRIPATAPNAAPTANPAKNLITDILFSPSFVVYVFIITKP